jgi:hypothetical protein
MLTNTCNKCEIEKPSEDFHKNKNRRCGLATFCKSCVTEYQRLNRQAIAEQQRRYSQSNKEAIAAKKREWHQNNPDKVNAKKARRKATKLQATPEWADANAIAYFYKQANNLTRLGVDTHVDHIVPLQNRLVCGLHCEANLQLLTAKQNISKGNRWWPDMW